MKRGRRWSNVRAVAAGDPILTDVEKRLPGAGKRVGLFVTCLVDLIRPSVGFAAVKLLENAGCKVVVPDANLLRPARL